MQPQEDTKTDQKKIKTNTLRLRDVQGDVRKIKSRSAFNYWAEMNFSKRPLLNV
jgi:hypothetical protein